MEDMNKNGGVENKKIPYVSQGNDKKQKVAGVCPERVKNQKIHGMYSKKVDRQKKASCVSLKNDNIQEDLQIEDISDEELLRLIIIAKIC